MSNVIPFRRAADTEPRSFNITATGALLKAEVIALPGSEGLYAERQWMRETFRELRNHKLQESAKPFKI